MTPAEVIADIVRRSGALRAHNIWIAPPDDAAIAPWLIYLSKRDMETAPLWGVPFAIKDNIDLKGSATTAACEAFTYLPERSAHVVGLLLQAGAIPVGKTNLDQFATGLVGVRSPYGACTHPDRPEHISGGSSSGSAVAVSCGLASFSLGTDTAGSGRIPAAFNRLVGYKPTRGLVSTTGVVPACKSIDCVSLFARCIEDATLIADTMIGFDEEDPRARPNSLANAPARSGIWSGRLKLGVIAGAHLQFFGDPAYHEAYHRTINLLRQSGVETTTIDFTPFQEAAAELYRGPWVAERYLATLPLIEEQSAALLDVTREIISIGRNPTAADLFRSQYRIAELRRATNRALADCDALLFPTAGKHYQLREVEDQPLVSNSNLGYYTNFMNLLDMCGIAMPGADTQSGLPFGISLIADGLQDAKLMAIARRIEATLSPNGSAHPAAREYRDPNSLEVVVCGAHMSGLALNWQLLERGATLVCETHTAARYRLFTLPGGPPYRPALIRDKEHGQSIDVEVWRMPAENVASFIELVPPPLGIGSVDLVDGRTLKGFICEHGGLDGAEEITRHGGWRRYLQSEPH